MKVTRARFWVELLATISALACALALCLATLGAAAGAAAAEPESTQAQPSQPSPDQTQSDQPQSAEPQSYEGIITDTHCGAKHSAAVGKSAADCTRVCVHSGEHFALVDGDKMYILEGEPDALKNAAGQRAKITGTLNGNTISVASVVLA